ncbi:hypothetical protein GCM10017653_05530 [Ancylobacter defluvii]|uniref:Uncharacterized protein n=1 Tax=Ancylobacter defluvii TaxID=1282440 RepID=A0A9W6JUE7_9HYPH|nr:hypothetical protein GCM10017653_05530 [Ancylobacter defluvii]
MLMDKVALKPTVFSENDDKQAAEEGGSSVAALPRYGSVSSPGPTLPSACASRLGRTWQGSHGRA